MQAIVGFPFAADRSYQPSVDDGDCAIGVCRGEANAGVIPAGARAVLAWQNASSASFAAFVTALQGM